MGVENVLIPVLLVGIYFIPTYIAERKKHYRRNLIVLINIVGISTAGILLFTESFGWFGRLIAAICWLVAFIWCFVHPQKSETVSVVSESTDSDDEKNA